MDKNIAALLREDAHTVHVSFDQVAEDFDDEDSQPTKAYTSNRPKSPNAKTYTYVTDLPLVVGDTVVVEAQGKINLAFIRRVDEDVKIAPNSGTTYRWVIAKVDMTGYEANIERNKEIEQAVSDAYRNNLRRSFAQQILSGVDDSHRESLQRLIGASHV
jgi:hypothetical protein